MSAITANAGLLADRADVIANPNRYRVLTGDRPTGPLHVGHYFGSLRNRVRLQDAGVTSLFIIADYQVITDRDAESGLRQHVEEMLLDYLALGVDPERSTVFTHSAVPELNQLLLPFLSLVSTAELDRNPTVKEEISASGRDTVSGLMYTYPAHEAADILFCGANLVPVGDDQLPHLELTRAIARRFNDRYAPLFDVPRALLSNAPRLGGLDGVHKMSKSRGNAIFLRDGEDETARLIKSAVTDSQRHIDFAPETRPGVSNLVMLAALCLDVEPYELANRIGGAGSAALKRIATEAVNEYFAPLRRRRRELDNDRGQALAILRAGNTRAREMAESTLIRVREAMSMRY